MDSVKQSTIVSAIATRRELLEMILQSKPTTFNFPCFVCFWLAIFFYEETVAVCVLDLYEWLPRENMPLTDHLDWCGDDQ